MPKRKFIEPFLLVILDKDNGVFTLEGPMSNDNPWNAAVCRAQEAGRNVTCSTVSSSRNEAIIYFKEELGLELVESGTIVQRNY